MEAIPKSILGERIEKLGLSTLALYDCRKLKIKFIGQLIENKSFPFIVGSRVRQEVEGKLFLLFFQKIKNKEIVFS